MTRPTRLRLLDERPAIPDRAEDAAAPAPVSVHQIPAEDASAIIAQLRAEAAQAVQERDAAVATAEKVKQETSATLEAVGAQARQHIAQVEGERDAARAELQTQKADRKETVAVATAVGLNMLQKAMAEAAKLTAWVPLLGSLLGGFWLFDDTVADPAPRTLVGLALYGAVVVLPAVLVTLKGCGRAKVS